MYKNRRNFIKGTSALIAAPMINFGSFKVFANTDTKYSSRTVDLVNESLVIDMLNQVTYLKNTWHWHKGEITEAEFQQFKDSGTDIVSFGTGATSFDDAITALAYRNSFIANSTDWFSRVDQPDEILQFKKQGKMGFIMGFQSMDGVLEEAEKYSMLRDLGLRVSGIVFNLKNEYGCGSFDLKDTGLTEKGFQLIELMNKHGVTVDLSHASQLSTLQGIKASRKPIIISHGGAKSVYNHRRAYSDEAIKEMAKRGGVLGIYFIRAMVSGKEPTTVEHVIDHIDYIRDLVGIEHIGVGSDYGWYGYDSDPEGRDKLNKRLNKKYNNMYRLRAKDNIDELNHPRRIFDFTEALVRRGYTNDQIKLILGENFKSVLTETWQPTKEATEKTV